MSVQVLQGDCIQVMRALKDNSVDSAVTDPPYGLEFMGKDWDSFGKAPTGGASFTKDGMGKGFKALPSFTGSPNPSCRNCGGTQRGNDRKGFKRCRCEKPDFPNSNLKQMRALQEWCQIWAAECLRVLKPGGHLLAFGGTRTYHRMACAIEDAGFEIRDSIHWVYATGFPKSKNLDGQWKGWGTALKPAHEPIVVARKPLTGTVVANVLEWGTGGINVDGCRVGTDKITTHSRGKNTAYPKRPGETSVEESGRVQRQDVFDQSERSGRWPPNLLLTHSAECEPAGTTVVRGDNRQGGTGRRPGGFGNVGADAGDAAPNGPLYGNASVRVWDCVPGCPVAEMDAQSGTLRARGNMKPSNSGVGMFHDRAVADDSGPGDSGGASRFFPVFRYQAKAPAKERVKVDGISHPTCKPLGLMRWLVRLVTPPGGICLDLFAGSGTTGEACLDEGFSCILIEREPDYIKLIRERLGRREPTLWDSLWE